MNKRTFPKTEKEDFHFISLVYALKYIILIHKNLIYTYNYLQAAVKSNMLSRSAVITDKPNISTLYIYIITFIHS